MADVISSWSELVELYEKLREEDPPVLYRGQSSTKALSTSFERKAVRYGLEPAERIQRERHLIREFQRHFHRFSRVVPEADDLDRWLSIMQHHGAPTRALDFTYSFWVAVFFAVERLSPSTHGSLWWFAWRRAFDLAEPEVPDLVADLRCDPGLGRVPGLVGRILQLDRELVLTFAPHELDERLAIQQAAHLIPLTVGKPLAEILALDAYSDVLGHVELCFDVTTLTEVIARLQDMNVERRVLFPGLDGLAAGLGQRIALRNLFPPAGTT